MLFIETRWIGRQIACYGKYPEEKTPSVVNSKRFIKHEVTRSLLESTKNDNRFPEETLHTTLEKAKIAIPARDKTARELNL